MLRDVAEGIAKFIREDEVFVADGHVSVVVEDKACVAYEVQQAVGQLGVCVLVAIEGFDRINGSPVPQGTLRIQISCFENPELNRDDISSMTAQAVMERLARILNYHRFPFLIGQMIFKSFSRDDVDEANIVRGNFEANTSLGYEERVKAAE